MFLGSFFRRLLLTRWAGHAKRNAMRIVELRLLLAIVLVLLGATVIVGLNFGEDDDPMAWSARLNLCTETPRRKAQRLSRCRRLSTYIVIDAIRNQILPLAPAPR